MCFGSCLSLLEIFFWTFTSKDTAYAAHDSAHGKNAFFIRKKNFAAATAAIVPALEDCQMLHRFQCGGFFGGKGIE